MKNKFTDRDLTKILRFPTVSWSSMDSFMSYDKDEWYDKYVLGKETEPNPHIIAGRIIGERLSVDHAYLPEVPRPEIYEAELSAKIGAINIVGHLDGLSMKRYKKLLEYKTSLSGKKWTAASVAKWGQIDFYCLLIWENYRIKPEDLHITLTYIPVKQLGSFDIVRSDDPVMTYKTTRTLGQVLVFGAKIKKVHEEMVKFVEQKKLSTD